MKFLYLFAAFSLLSQLTAEEFKVGTGIADISPSVTPFQLRSGKSQYVHDPLHVRALAFENGKGRALITLVDAIGVGREMTDEAKQKVAEKTGWNPKQMLVAGTHTHTAPKGGETSPGRIAYEKTRREGLAQAMINAIEALEPAKVGFASDEEPSEVRNRRWYFKEGSKKTLNPLGGYDKVRTNGGGIDIVKPAGPVDPEICVIDVRNKKGRPLGLIANYALHYVGGIPKVTEENGRVVGMASADYFGEFARIMPYRVGGSKPPANFVAMMTNGASGDINNLTFNITRAPRAPFEQVKIVASKAADTAWRAVKKIEAYDQSPLIATRQREVTLNYRKPTADEVAKAMKLLELTMKERNAIHKRTNSVANRTVEYASPEGPKTEEVIIQAIRIGDQAIVSMPFEVLVEIGLEIKAKSPFPHTFLIELANGGYGYLPPPNQHELGGYETWLGTSRFEENSSVILIRELLEMLEELKALG